MAVSAFDGMQDLKNMFRRQIDYSWKKSITGGIDQSIKKAPVRFSEDYINERSERIRWLIDTAVPVMEKFHLFFDLSHSAVALADENAVVIAGTGNGKWGESVLRCGFDIGTSCSEEYIGTNAIGTCLATGKSICVIGKENYVKQWQDSANAATVIRDPFTGNIIGALCLTCFVKYFHVLSLGIVQAIADVIEEKLRNNAVPARRKDRPSRASIASVSRAVGRMSTGVFMLENRETSSYARTGADFVFGSSSIGILLNKAKKAAQYDSTKLIVGESGVGKEVLARFIHEHSPRRSNPFVAINCAAIPPNLLASELFGYETGAFTGAKRGGNPGRFEQASGGTVYLDEISEMSMDLQACLLRVIEEKTITPLGGGRPHPVDVQIIASSNRDLMDMMDGKQFRSDLYHRLNVISFHIPSLRERREDIPRLVEYFLEKMRDKHGGDVKKISDRAVEALLDYHWPGNVRELENTIERACIFSEGPVIDVTDLKEEIGNGCHGQSGGYGELHRILSVLRKHRGNLSRTACSLGIARSTLYRKMARYNISRASI
ncbi:MAG: sigma 54-interacting transcriptional regulator [Deltaproteobacteria bacterium]|nr:sigma 54-interacting transcriptional regulator [Deltaproteobacteria bacterium]